MSFNCVGNTVIGHRLHYTLYILCSHTHINRQIQFLTHGHLFFQFREKKCSIGTIKHCQFSHFRLLNKP